MDHESHSGGVPRRPRSGSRRPSTFGGPDRPQRARQFTNFRQKVQDRRPPLWRGPAVDREQANSTPTDPLDLVLSQAQFPSGRAELLGIARAVFQSLIGKLERLPSKQFASRADVMRALEQPAEHKEEARRDPAYVPVRASPAQIARFLKSTPFPASKGDIMYHADESGAPEDVLKSLRRLHSREFASADEVLSELSAAGRGGSSFPRSPGNVRGESAE
jgi:hypothetical protein